MFSGKHLGKYVKYVQQIDLDGCHINIYQDGISIQHFIGATPNEDWMVSKKLKNFVHVNSIKLCNTVYQFLVKYSFLS